MEKNLEDRISALENSKQAPAPPPGMPANLHEHLLARNIDFRSLSPQARLALYHQAQAGTLPVYEPVKAPLVIQRAARPIHAHVLPPGLSPEQKLAFAYARDSAIKAKESLYELRAQRERASPMLRSHIDNQIAAALRTMKTGGLSE